MKPETAVGAGLGSGVLLVFLWNGLLAAWLKRTGVDWFPDIPASVAAVISPALILVIHNIFGEK